MPSQAVIQPDAMLEMLSYANIIKKFKKNQRYVMFYMNWTLTFFSFTDYLESCVRVFHFLQTLEHIDMRDLWGMYPSINKRTLSGHFPVKRLLN